MDDNSNRNTRAQRFKGLYFLFYILIFCSIFSPLAGFSQVYYDQPYKESVILPNCEVLKTCSLEHFSIFVQNYKIVFNRDDVSFGTRMFSEIETNTTADLEDYSIVQFVKGCQFKSRKVGEDVQYIYAISRNLFNKVVPFVHKSWQIDSSDTDAMFNNTPKEYLEEWGTRHGLYYWNRVEGSYNQETEVAFYKERPETPRFYVMNHPGTAFFQNGVAKNVSLQYKTCLYKTDTVPSDTHEDDLDFASPLHCFEWATSFIYDHTKNDFIKTNQLHSACM